MKKEELYETIEEIDEKYIIESEAIYFKKKHVWVKFAAAVACLCLIVAGTMKFVLVKKDDNNVLHWSKSFSASDYFKNCQNGNSQNSNSSSSLSMPPYAVSISIDEKRKALENDEILPAMPNHLEQNFSVAYNGDGSLYKVNFLWMRRSEQGLDDYSNLEFIASPKELHEVSDNILVELDSDGKIIPENVTVTKRDGILIYTKGNIKAEKSIAWQTENCWCQINGSWNDSYEDMVELLDWFWEHPFILSDFDDSDEIFMYSNRAEYPEVFSEQIPDFSALNYTTETEDVNLAFSDGNYVPVWFKGIYSKGNIRISWEINVGADDDAWKICLGSPDDISEKDINEAISQNRIINIFFDSPCMASLTIENGITSDVMDIIQMLH